MEWLAAASSQVTAVNSHGTALGRGMQALAKLLEITLWSGGP